MLFAIYGKAKKNSGKKSIFAVIEAGSDKRALRDFENLVEDNNLNEEDYFKPAITHTPVVDDLPETGALSETWCDRYQLQDDKKTWLPAQTPAPDVATEKTGAEVLSELRDQFVTPRFTGTVAPQESVPEAAQSDEAGPQDDSAEFAGGEINPAIQSFRDSNYPELKTVATLPFRQRLLAEFLSDEFVYHADAELMRAVTAAEMDTDNSYLQNLILAAENVPEFKTAAREPDLAFLSEAIKAIWPVSGKKPDLNILMVFIRDWWATPHINRGIFVKSWRTGKPCGPILMNTTTSGTNAGGNNQTDRGEGFTHTLDTLDLEMAAALLPMDFDIYQIPAGVLRRCKEMVAGKEKPFKAWSGLLRQSPGILDYSRAAIFALVRSAPEGIESDPVKHLEYINRTLTEANHDAPAADTLAAARHLPAVVDAAKTEEEKPENICTSCGALGGGHCPDCGPVCGDVTYAEMAPALKEEVGALEFAPVATEPEAAQIEPGPGQIEPETARIEPETAEAEPKPAQMQPVPETAAQRYFEPGRYEGVHNAVYHAANGISSSMIKDARVSLLYYHGRHVARTIKREETDALFFGALVHALTLEPEKFDEEYIVFPGVPAGAISTSSEMKEVIERYNASMPPVIPADEIKRQIESYNAQLPAPLSMSANTEETAALYAALPDEFRTIPEGEKQTAGLMRECLKKYNATLPATLKTSGGRDALLDQLATVDPEYVAIERAKPQPYNTSGNKDDLKKIVREINPRVIFADEFTAQWREVNAARQIVSFADYQLLREMHAAVYAHPNAGKMLRHSSRAVEVSYFGVDAETGLEVRIRPDLEITIGGVRIAMDLKTITAGKIKEVHLKQKIHREIIDRDYHVSAAMYCEVGGFDQFFWIFVNKDKGHHWCALVEASSDLLALGSLEYHQTKQRISDALDSGNWQAPINDFTDELNDFDARRLESLRMA
ncbi:PD-(D/E)XK nuclease-like domain-containing protein [Escherichia coli]|nr:PD-(D/E)XK nuclease-like domain-containing protein [Escherichia coli]